ncbi:MAG: VOC family protein [Pseudorhodoplanes sp.]
MAHLIRQMGYVVIAVLDPERSARDLADITGVRITQSDMDAAYVSSNSRFCEIAYLRGTAHGIRAVGLEAIDEAAVDEVARRAQSDGLTILSDKPSLPKVKRAVRFATPFGPIFEIHTPIERETIAAAALNGKRVRRLEHVNLRATDPRGFHDLVVALLGMKLSDRTTQYERAWYRAADGFHHTFAAGPGNGLHHYAFDAHGFTDLAATADALVAKGRSLLWGLGRHGPGNNLFSYYLDPDGCVVEVSFGLERVDNDDLHKPGNWPFDSASNVLDRWGSKPPEAYGKAITPFLP